jgi:hypothetical protein
VECATITRRVLPSHQSAPETYNDVTFHGSAFPSSGEKGQMWTNLSLFQATEFWSMKSKESAMHVPQGLANRILLSRKVIMINQHWWNPGTRVQMLKVFLGRSTNAWSFRRSRLKCSFLTVNLTLCPQQNFLKRLNPIAPNSISTVNNTYTN